MVWLRNIYEFIDNLILIRIKYKHYIATYAKLYEYSQAKWNYFNIALNDVIKLYAIKYIGQKY
jgi:hypothetical protein